VKNEEMAVNFKAMNFRSKGSFAISDTYDVRVCRPRVLPGRGGNEIEVEYDIYIDGVRHGLYFLGSYSEPDQGSPAVQTTHLDSILLVEDILKLKPLIGYKGDDFEFLTEMSDGLVSTYASGSGIASDTLYLITASARVIDERLPGSLARSKISDRGDVILASLDLHVSARDV
jgi:hypothetical protein